MSWNFQLQLINRSFERITAWYNEFMRRTESSFRALHERIVQLERRQSWAGGPSDEQLERILRKILAERFNPGIQPDPPPAPTSNPMSDQGYFVQNPKDRGIPRPVQMDIASLLVNPDSVPSKAYSESLRMLEGGLTHFPHVQLNQYEEEDEEEEEDEDDDDDDDDDGRDVKMTIIEDKRPRHSNSI